MGTVAEEHVVTTPGIRISGARKHFRRDNGETVPAVDGVDLTVGPGEFVVLLGPSGCGKTTLLRSIAGLERLDSGRVERGGVVLFDADRRIDLPPERRRVSMMFQSYALWPHLTVAGNVGYPLRARGVGRADTRRRVAEILAIAGIGELADQLPSQISGGQQQRVALARALVAGDGVVLFDEPLSNVDARVREHLRGELRRLHRELGFTAVYVTHDQDEALALATSVVVLERGRVAQSAPPAEVYRRPHSAYVARFLGAVNELTGTVLRSAGSDPGTDGPLVTVATPIGEITGVAEDPLAVGAEVLVFSRPETWRRVPADSPADAEESDPTGRPRQRWSAQPESSTFHGFYTDRLYRIDGATIRLREVGDPPTGDGAPETVTVDPSDVRVLSARDGA